MKKLQTRTKIGLAIGLLLMALPLFKRDAVQAGQRTGCGCGCGE